MECGQDLMGKTGAENESAGMMTASQTITESPISPGTDKVEINNASTSTWAKWLDIGSKAAGLGSPLAAALDFLSPRIALLPIAATVAITGLLATIALRKFVAHSLPITSKFRAALAPEEGLHRSGMVIGTGVLSALMVTGAAWSSANAPQGGIIAGKFDGARVAQVQIGLIQSIQKEQRQQTAVLEDIREGRANDPRRELGNIGGGFNDNELDSALDRGDSRTVKLLLAGGLKWRVSNAYVAYSSGDSKTSALLLEYKDAFILRNGDCEKIIAEKFGSAEQLSTMNGAAAKIQINLLGRPSKQLEPFQKSFMKAFCGTPEVKQFIKTTISKIQQEQQKSTSSRNLCVENKMAARPSTFESQKRRKEFKMELCATSDCSYSGDRLLISAHDERKYTAAVQDVCTEEFPLGSTGEMGKALDLSYTYQQLLDSIT